MSLLRSLKIRKESSLFLRLILRQGDPISPFLFIIAIEGLHVVMEDVVLAGRFKGINMNDSNLIIFHLFYANDLLFLENVMRGMFVILS